MRRQQPRKFRYAKTTIRYPHARHGIACAAVTATATVVLVHGGGTTARFWDRLRDHLDHVTVAVDLPGRASRPADLQTISVDDEVASVVTDVADATSGPLVLVAHSSGGLAVPGIVAALDGRVRRVVLNAALVPLEGGCGLDCMRPHHAEALRAVIDTARRDETPLPTFAPPEDVEKLRTSFGGDPLDDATLAYVADPVRNVTDTVYHYLQPVHWSIAAAVPVTYVVNDHDRPVPTALQDEMLTRLPRPARVIRLPTGHIPAVTHPELLARAIGRE